MLILEKSESILRESHKYMNKRHLHRVLCQNIPENVKLRFGGWI